jgi:hypothetical protein
MIVHLLKSRKNSFKMPSILLKLVKIDNDINVNIKPSSTILFLLKLICKFNILDNLDTQIILKEPILNKTLKEYIEKHNNLLDLFMIEISKQYDNPIKCLDNEDNEGNKGNKGNVDEIYSICINYIIDMAKLSYTLFDVVFDVFIKYLDAKFINNKFNVIKNTISISLKNEITMLEQNMLE